MKYVSAAARSIALAHNPAMPGVWLSVAAACGLVAALVGKGHEESV